MRRRPPRNPLFSRRRFEDNVIIRCVRWYLRFKLSYRDLAEIAWELGVSVAPCTIFRWGGAVLRGVRPTMASLDSVAKILKALEGPIRGVC